MARDQNQYSPASLAVVVSAHGADSCFVPLVHPPLCHAYDLSHRLCLLLDLHVYRDLCFRLYHHGGCGRHLCDHLVCLHLLGRLFANHSQLPFPLHDYCLFRRRLYFCRAYLATSIYSFYSCLRSCLALLSVPAGLSGFWSRNVELGGRRRVAIFYKVVQPCYIRM